MGHNLPNVRRRYVAQHRRNPLLLIMPARLVSAHRRAWQQAEAGEDDDDEVDGEAVAIGEENLDRLAESAQDRVRPNER